MKYIPKKVFVKMGNEYTDLGYEDFCHRVECDAEYSDKWFIAVQGCLLEVDHEQYADFYRDKRRQKYLDERSALNGDISFDMLTTRDFNGEDALVSNTDDVCEQVARRILLDKLHTCLPLLTAEERALVHALFYDGLSEREWSAICGVPQKTINDRKHRILRKLKKLMEN